MNEDACCLHDAEVHTSSSTQRAENTWNLRWKPTSVFCFSSFLSRTCSLTSNQNVTTSLALCSDVPAEKTYMFFCAIARKWKSVDLQRNILHLSVPSCVNNYGCYTISAFALNSQPPATRRVCASLWVVFGFQWIWGLVCFGKLLGVFIRYLKCGIDVTFCSGRLRLFCFVFS